LSFCILKVLGRAYVEKDGEWISQTVMARTLKKELAKVAYACMALEASNFIEGRLHLTTKAVEKQYRLTARYKVFVEELKH
jgi:hypothetical protein